MRRSLSTCHPPACERATNVKQSSRCELYKRGPRGKRKNKSHLTSQKNGASYTYMGKHLWSMSVTLTFELGKGTSSFYAVASSSHQQQCNERIAR